MRLCPARRSILTPPAPWLIGGPYRLYETPQAGTINWPLWYADFLTVPGHPEFNGQFFNCLVEVRDESSCNEWCPSQQRCGRAALPAAPSQAKREMDSMVLGQLYTHEWYLIPIPQSSNQTPISSNNWSAILQGITNNLGAYNPNLRHHGLRLPICAGHAHVPTPEQRLRSGVGASDRCPVRHGGSGHFRLCLCWRRQCHQFHLRHRAGILGFRHRRGGGASGGRRASLPGRPA